MWDYKPSNIFCVSTLTDVLQYEIQSIISRYNIHMHHFLYDITAWLLRVLTHWRVSAKMKMYYKRSIFISYVIHNNSHNTCFVIGHPIAQYSK